MTYKNFESLLNHGLIPEGSCVAAALDAVSKRHSINLALYQLAGMTSRSLSEGRICQYTAEDIYRILGSAVGCGDPSEWLLPTEYTTDNFAEQLRHGKRIIGEFTMPGHTVGLTKDLFGFHLVGSEITKRHGKYESGKIAVTRPQQIIEETLAQQGWIRILPSEE
jgi:hypothetical protein